MTENELKEKYCIFADSWRFYRKWVVCKFPMANEQWEQVAKEAHEIREKYGGSRMVEYMMLGVTEGLEELERQCDAKKEMV
jgi:hypothetical protein